ncbi:hypothetical protein [Nocardioides panzhihuensis]|uniref:Putative membrane protein n=1 Tax=Nocardioides panzhihuensis TaxID=860243 RepID=A0A7Z0IRL8_9ACTN|nr:hypothetical protein [Nocardioides panzhihuensis]NYI76938.1 putative membrane protein [Nocardioides panzhihuensis]
MTPMIGLPAGAEWAYLIGGIMLLVWCAITVWWLMMLVQALRTPDSVWTAAGQSKILYVLLMIFLGWIGALLYVFIARPGLRA